MSYRPYPNPGRALHQLDRHTQTRPPTALEQRLAEQAQAALAAGAAAMRPFVEAMKRNVA